MIEMLLMALSKHLIQAFEISRIGKIAFFFFNGENGDILCLETIGFVMVMYQFSNILTSKSAIENLLSSIIIRISKSEL